jgi:large subunit ribosomal protein L3
MPLTQAQMADHLGMTPVHVNRVLKGLRMAAHQGADKVTVRNLEILRSDPARSLLVIAGAVPGGKNGIVMVRKA